MIDDVLILAKNQLYDRNIVPVFLYQGSPPIIMGVRDQIQSVILNIVINAIDVMPEGGYIYVDLDLTEETEGVKVKIRDTGTGMDKNIMDHLFNPFFTTKEEGVGLGLYLCNEIINNHNGYIEVDSEVGKGTIFSFWLPKGDCPEEEDYDK
jgi:two-component system NtrC family sensor kinase